MATHKYWDTLNLHFSQGKSEWKWLTSKGGHRCMWFCPTNRKEPNWGICSCLANDWALLRKEQLLLFLRAGNTCSLLSHSYPDFCISIVRTTAGHERPLHWYCSSHLPKSQTKRQVIRACQSFSPVLCLLRLLLYTQLRGRCRAKNTAQGCSHIQFNGKRQKTLPWPSPRHILLQ